LTAIGDTLRENGETDGAVLAYRESIGRDPNFPHSHHWLAHSLRAQGRLDEAVSEFRIAAKLEPNNHWNHTHISEIYIEKGNLTEGLAQHQLAVRLAATDSSPLAYYAFALRRVDDFDKAIGLLQQAVSLSPRNQWMHFHLGETQRMSGDFDAAEVSLRESL